MPTLELRPHPERRQDSEPEYNSHLFSFAREQEQVAARMVLSGANERIRERRECCYYAQCLALKTQLILNLFYFWLIYCAI